MRVDLHTVTPEDKSAGAVHGSTYIVYYSTVCMYVEYIHI